LLSGIVRSFACRLGAIYQSADFRRQEIKARAPKDEIPPFAPRRSERARLKTGAKS
jgi:hypothetical protein